MDKTETNTSLVGGSDDHDIEGAYNIIGSDADSVEEYSGDDESEFPSQRSSSERDEVKEIQKMAEKDNKSVMIWRLAATFALLVTAFFVTYTSYTFLKREEKKSFEIAFEQFSRTLSDASLAQQRDLRDGLEQLGTYISSYANNNGNNESFPTVTIPDFVVMGQHTVRQTHVETLGFQPLVLKDQKDAWEAYADSHKDWVVESHMERFGNLSRLKQGPEESYNYHITVQTKEGLKTDIDTRDYYIPAWLNLAHSPPTYAFSNVNIAAIIPGFFDTFLELQNETLFTQVMRHPGIPTSFSREEHAKYHSKLLDSSVENPHSFFCAPVYALPGDKTSGIAGSLTGAVALDVALLNLLPEGVEGIHVVVKNTCQQEYTYNIVGPDAFYLGDSDKHDPQYDHMEVKVDWDLHTHPNFRSAPVHCRYSMHVYPSKVFEKSYDSNSPEIFAIVVAVTFVLVAIAFFIYDWMQYRRNMNLVYKAAQSNSIVTSLIPDMMRERLLEEARMKQNVAKRKSLKTFVNDGGDANKGGKVNPMQLTTTSMADLFLETTVILADICGFTSWSSARQPEQVFTLLESIYHQFDVLAKKRRIFKVETVADCYVAVCGLPNPNPNHAPTAARFASDIMHKFHLLTKELEVALGPDTADLDLRVGMHSGPVTAGILRGERSRFQLFGDTMNTCGQIEQTGRPSFIHCSKETAQLLIEAGKQRWVTKREDRVSITGKGTMETFWVQVKGVQAGSVCSTSSLQPHWKDSLTFASKTYGVALAGLDERTNRCVNWNVEMLLHILKQLVAHRSSRRTGQPGTHMIDVEGIPLEQVREIIALPAEAKVQKNKKQIDPEEVEIPGEVVAQLHHLVSKIASMYNENPFHNFDHASHVVMSVTKLLSRIAAPDDLNQSQADINNIYGISSHPLTQFACAFSALIHDVDHVGVSNAQLVQEGVPLASKYNNRSIAEQNSLDLSWSLLMSSDYKELRSFLFHSQEDLQLFRQLVVNSVMATDIVDKDLKALRNGRWDKAFKVGEHVDHVDNNPQDVINRKATIIIEHIIQASDISHTMQHWHVYRKWNQKLFEELYVAYLSGRSANNPVEFWWKGEFGFFDFYIIPLAKKLKDCGVFGVSSGEFLSYARKNREEWEAQGQEAVAQMYAEACEKYGVKNANDTATS